MARSKRRSKSGKRSKRRGYRAAWGPPPAPNVPQFIGPVPNYDNLRIVDLGNITDVNLLASLGDAANNDDLNTFQIKFLNRDINPPLNYLNDAILFKLRTMRDTFRKMLITAADRAKTVNDLEAAHAMKHSAVQIMDTAMNAARAATQQRPFHAI